MENPSLTLSMVSSGDMTAPKRAAEDDIKMENPSPTSSMVSSGDITAPKRAAVDDISDAPLKKPRTEGFSADQLALHKKSQNDRTACSKLRTKLRKTAEFANLPDTSAQEAFLELKVAELMDQRDARGISAATLESEIMQKNKRAEEEAQAAFEKRMRSTLTSMAKSRSESSGKTPAASALDMSMGENFQRRLNPILAKYTKHSMQQGLRELELAGSANAEEEHQQWIKNTVEDPAKVLAMLDNEEDREDAVASAEAGSSSGSSDVEVVVSSDEDEVDESEAGDSEDFIATSDEEELGDSDRDDEDNEDRQALELDVEDDYDGDSEE